MTCFSRSSTLVETAYEVSRFLLKERDLANLLQGICDRLTAHGLNPAVFLVLLDQDSGGVITAEAGLGERFAPIMAQLRGGRIPRCGKFALEADQGQAALVSSCDCGVCNRSNTGPTLALSTAIRCSSSLSGFLVLQLPPAIQPDPREPRLLAELADSIAQTLRQLFAEEAAREREQELRRIEERYELALNASQAGLWDWNIRTGEMYISPDHWELLDYREGDGNTAGPARCIHPEDRDQVLAVLNEHLTGKTEEYRIEYRVQEKNGEWTWFLDRGRVVERDQNQMPVRMTGTHQNITLQKKQDQALAVVQQQLHEAVNHERNFLQTVIDSAGDPVMVIDLDYNLLLINQAAARLVRNKEAIGAMQGQKCYHLFCGAGAPCQDPRFPCPVTRVKSHPHQVKLIHNPFHGNGVNNTFELDVSPLKDSQGNLYGIIEVARDITDRLRIEKELRDSQSHLYRLAHHDALTGLPNRLLFMDRLTQAVTKASRNRSRVAVLFLDLDRFKAINDTLGHDVGDGLLVEVAARLQRQCRQSDTVARLGGDEFVFVLENIGSRKDAAVVAAKVMNGLTAPMRIKGCELQITTSIGIAFFPDDSESIEGVVKCADLALYAAKEIGRSNFQFYRRDIEQNGRRPQMDECYFQNALKADEFFIRYLPQVTLDGGQLAGFDTLLLWQHPQMGPLPPEPFLAAAEECGMLASVSERSLELVCAALQSWLVSGCDPVPVTVAISLRQATDPEFLPQLKRILARHGVPPELLTLQFPEQAVTEAADHELKQLGQLGRLGIGLAMGAFGAAQSSPARLQHLPLGRVAVNHRLLAAVPGEREAEVLLTALIGLARALGLPVLAEGIDREEQRDFLRLAGCDLGQGPLVSPPLDSAQVEARLQSRKNGG